MPPLVKLEDVNKVLVLDAGAELLITSDFRSRTHLLTPQARRISIPVDIFGSIITGNFVNYLIE